MNTGQLFFLTDVSINVTVYKNYSQVKVQFKSRLKQMVKKPWVHNTRKETPFNKLCIRFLAING